MGLPTYILSIESYTLGILYYFFQFIFYDVMFLVLLLSSEVISYRVLCYMYTHMYTIYKQESQIRDAALFMLNVKLYSVTRINWFPVCWHNKRSYLKTNVEYQCKLFINSLLSKFATVKSYHSGTFGLWIASKSLGLFLEDKATEQKTGNYWA